MKTVQGSQFKAFISILVILLTFSFCGSDDKKSKAPDNDVGLQQSLYVDIPNSVSNPEISGSLSAKPAAGFLAERATGTAGEIATILGIVRDFAAIAEDAAIFIEEDILSEFYGKIIMTKEVGQLFASCEKYMWKETLVLDIDASLVGDWIGSGGASMGDIRIKIAPGLNGYERQVSLWKILPDDGSGNRPLLKLVEANWLGEIGEGKSRSDAKGVVTISGFFLDIDETLPGAPKTRLQFVFNLNDATWGHYMEVYMSNLPIAGENVVNSMYLFAAQKDGIVNLSANAYIENAAIITDNFLTSPSNYVFSGAAEVDSDIGILNVALPAASITTTSDMYTNYSIGDTYKTAVANVLKTSSDQDVVDFRGFFADPPYNIDIASLTTEQVVAAFVALVTNYPQLAADPSLKGLLFAFTMENPVYFDSSGYKVHGPTAPEGYDALVSSLSKADVMQKSPQSIVDLNQQANLDFIEPNSTDLVNFNLLDPDNRPDSCTK